MKRFEMCFPPLCRGAWGAPWGWGDCKRFLGTQATVADTRAARSLVYPVASRGSGVWTQVEAGYQHTCGLESTGGLYCWVRTQLLSRLQRQDWL